VIGDGARLFAATLNNPQEVFAASYARPDTWARLETPGLPSNPSQNMYVMAIDPAHHLLYGGAQAAGMFRVVTQ
jgi:hypothetical protein